jgi:hypothetical protein
MLSRATVLLVALLVTPAVGVQFQGLADFFKSSTDGLSMSTSDAEALAKKELGYLTQTGVNVSTLKTLRKIMYSPSGMDMSLSDVRLNLLPLAYQHPDANDLPALYSALYSSSKVDLAKKDAQMNALSMAEKHAEPCLLGPLYQVLYSTSGVDLPKSQAQQQAIDLTLAGADTGTLKSEYLASRSKYGSAAALQWAIQEAVKFNLGGLDERYAQEDLKAYTAKGFQDYYKTSWLTAWVNAPKQKRTAPDGRDYFASEFKVFFGDSWASYWTKAPIATQRRIAGDGQTYTMQEFKQYYADKWVSEWFKAYEVLDLCAGLNHASCDADNKCQWQWTGDWTTSCVPKPLRGEQVGLVV